MLWRRLLPAVLLLLSAGCAGKAASHPVLHHPAGLMWSVVSKAPLSLDPAGITSIGASYLSELTNEGLVGIGPGLRVEPAAADAWTISANGLHYVFHVRPDARFSDGTVLTTADVVGSLRRALTESGTGRVLPIYIPEIARINGIADIRRLDDSHLAITLSRPAPALLAQLALPAASIVDMKIVHRFGSVWTPHAVGLGPYQQVRWAPGQSSVTLIPNTYAWTHARFKRITVRFSRRSVALQAFTGGKTDLVSPLLPTVKFLHRFGGAAHVSPTANLDFVAINTRKPFLREEAVRRAFSLAVDRPRVTRATFGPAAKPSGSLVPPLLLPGAYQQVTDDAAALHQLALSGHPFGAHLPHFRLLVPNTPHEIHRARLLTTVWEHVLAVHISTIALSPPQYVSAVERGHYQLALVRWGAQYPDAANFLEDQLLPSGRQDVSGWDDPHFVRLMGKTLLRPIDSPERRADLLGAEQIAAIQAPWIALDTPTELTLRGTRATGISLSPSGPVGLTKTARLRHSTG